MMKRLILVAFLLLSALPAQAAITLVQHTNSDCNTATFCALAYGSNVVAGHLLVIVVRIGVGTGCTITTTDSITNSYTNTTTNIDSANGQCLQDSYVCSNSTSAADTVTATYNASVSSRIAIYEYSGAATSNCLDVQNTGIGTGTAPASTSITPSANNELVLAASGYNNTETVTAGTNFTLEDQVPAAPNTRMAAEDWIQTTATATTGPMTINASQTWVANVVAFKAAGGAAAPAGMNKREKLELLDP